MAFCGKCGAELDGGKFCPSCGAPVESGQSETAIATTGSVRKSNVWIKVAVAVVAVIILVFAISRFTSLVDEPCDWCGNSPSVAYKMSDNSYSYVCRDCSKVCALCGEKATKHYENLLGMMVFVCDDFYDGLQ